MSALHRHRARACRRARAAKLRAAIASSFAVIALCALPPSALADPPPPAVDPWFGQDKALHFGASAFIAGGGYGLSSFFTDELAGRIAFGAALAIGAGIAKEALDSAGLGTASARDFSWDLIGMTAGVGIAVTVDLAID